MRKASLIALVGLLPVVMALATQDSVLLRRELVEGAADVYQYTMRSEQVMDMEGGPGGGMQQPFDMSTTMKIAFKVKNVDQEAGKADLDISVTDIKMDFGQMAGMMGGDFASQMPSEMKMGAKLDRRNRVSGLQNLQARTRAGGMMPMAAMMGGGFQSSIGPMFVEFPEQAVRVGDTWEVTIPRNPMTGNKDVKLKAALVGEAEHDGKPAVTLTLQGEMPLDVDLAELVRDDPNLGGMMAGMKMVMTGSIEMKGEALVLKESGRTVRMEMLMQSRQRMTMPDFGMTVNIVGSSTLKMALL